MIYNKLNKPHIYSLLFVLLFVLNSCIYEQKSNDKLYLKIEKEISSFVVPIGATVNMDGSAIYLGLSAVFMAQLLNLSLSIDQYVIISLTATIGSIGAAGVPSVALVMMTIVFSSIGIPIEAIAIIAGVDRLLDMFRTSINVAGDLTISKLVDKISRN